MHIPRRKNQNIQNIINPEKCCPVNAAIKKTYTFSAKLTFFFLGCVKRELPQRRRQDLLINASKCHKLSYKASKRNFFFFFAERYFFVPLLHNQLRFVTIISDQLIYSNKHIATLISSLPLAIQEAGMLDSLSSRSYLDVRHGGINKILFFFGYRYCSSSSPKPLHSVLM